MTWQSRRLHFVPFRARAMRHALSSRRLTLIGSWALSFETKHEKLSTPRNPAQAQGVCRRCKTGVDANGAAWRPFFFVAGPSSGPVADAVGEKVVASFAPGLHCPAGHQPATFRPQQGPSARP